MIWHEQGQLPSFRTDEQNFKLLTTIQSMLTDTD